MKPLLAAVVDVNAAVVKAFFAKRKDFDKATDIYNAFVEGCKGNASKADKKCETLHNKAIDGATIPAKS